jgi:uncharacterized protein (UPF0332 family)
MTQDNLSDEERREILVRNWEEKAHEALRAAKLLREAGILDAAVNRAYYACFYSVSAVLTKEQKSFRKHSGDRAWLHKEMVKKNRLDASWGKLFDWLFENRYRADYQCNVGTRRHHHDQNRVHGSG